MTTEIAILGGGPAGLCAALSAAGQGARVTLVDRGRRLGGQLVKQTHRFFGSEHEHAGTRGIDIARILADAVAQTPGVEVRTDTTVLAIYGDGVIALEEAGRYRKLTAGKVIVATGAAEKMLPFPHNDLPGVYGAGAVQTLMNEHGVVPGRRVLMVGAGNIGLIVAYQLLQAGVEVAAVIEAAPQVGGYHVHAAKIRRAGVPVLPCHTVVRALGREWVEGAEICRLDAGWNPVPDTNRVLEVDTVCLAVGLSPLVELLWQAGCPMKFVPELGGHVPVRDARMETLVPGLYVAGDASGVEEASSAMLEGKIAGLCAAAALGYDRDADRIEGELRTRLAALRAGPVGQKIRRGLERLGVEEVAA
ncbi:MAG: FAD-dependent oxidoreductase [Deferrisomatales bacterium]